MSDKRNTRPAKARSQGVIFSFFAGAGFLDLGFESAGFEVVFVNEIHTPFLKAYKHARSGMGISQPRFGYHAGDMASLTTDGGRKHLKSLVDQVRKEGRIVGFIGGPPCPDFSIAGKNGGRSGKHGKLSQTYTQLIKQQKPDFFLFENVKGLWKTKEHREFYEELKRQLRANRYATTERLINALEYGVAQDRDRIILVGFSKQLFPSPDKVRPLLDLFPWQTDQKYNRDAIDKIKKNKTSVRMPEDLTVNFWFKRNEVSSHPNAKHHFKPQVLAKFKNIAEGDVSKKSFKRLHRNRYSPTAAYGNNEVHLHPRKPRRISAAEALAIQSLPKQFAFPEEMTLSDMFKAVGNGVPFVAARAMAKSIKKFLAQQEFRPRNS